MLKELGCAYHFACAMIPVSDSIITTTASASSGGGVRTVGGGGTTSSINDTCSCSGFRVLRGGGSTVFCLAHYVCIHLSNGAVCDRTIVRIKQQ